ncbi:lysozyme inhibitor LprI family protein [Luteibacter sahnii]|uniref:lysozyme inhibitor LprI family protein n=1 Tax=Luteibacter sahnii TaxID=3021977 RepID=UPI002A6A9708|nr:lysozyme inhibitor LprI family protein [Luteibacter sp. PPL193]MDY1547447.1 lysozyme inhibitor LprI family protein [Luteibacter sp. PPL193]
MTPVKTFAIAAALVLHATGAMAAASTSDVIKRQAPRGITPTFYACVDKARGTTDQGACLDAEKKAQDARLNTAYKALMGKLSDKEKESLKSAENAWLDYRTKSGNLESAVYGDEPVADLTVTQNDIFRLCDRANVLEKYLTVVNDR